jgi:predicted nucleic acid-binding protein
LIYLDTSIVAAFYWAEELSDAVEELLNQEAEVAVSQLVEVELCSALSRRVRMREIEPDEAQSIANLFLSDLNNGLFFQFSLEPVHYNMARDWIRQFNTPLRTLDALHLAIAFFHRVPLVTADEGLAVSAVALGVEVRILRREG